MNKMCLAAVLAALVLTPLSATCATTKTKIGKVRVSHHQNFHLTTVKFGRADGGVFDGCTVDAGFVSTIRLVPGSAIFPAQDALSTLLMAKQNGLEVLVGYHPNPDGRCSLRALEIQ